MAFYNELDDQDEQQVQEQGPVTTGQASGIIGTGTSSDSKVPQAGASVGKSAASSAPTFAGINDYLRANKTQAEKLGQNVANTVSNQANEARQSVGNLQNAASEQIKPVSQLDEGIFNTIQTGAETLTPEQRQQVKSVVNYQYSGPTDYTQLGDAYSNAANSVKNATQVLQNTQTEEGRVNLLSQLNGGRRTQGVNTFDAALLSAGGGRQELENVANQNKDLQDLFNTTTSNITNQIGRLDDPNTPENEATGVMGQSQMQSQAAKKAVQDALAAWTASFNPKVQTTQQDLIDKQNRIAQDLAGTDRYALTDETLQLLGLEEGMNTYGVDLNRFLQQADPSQINAANVASAEDYARYLALADLGGINPTILQAGNEALAGTAPDIKYDKEELQKAINLAKNPYLENVYSNYYIGTLPDNATLRTNSYGNIPSTAGRNMTANDLLAAIQDFETRILPSSPGSKTYNILLQRLNNAKKIYNDFMTGVSHNGIGIGNATAIKKEK